MKEHGGDNKFRSKSSRGLRSLFVAVFVIMATTHYSLAALPTQQGSEWGTQCSPERDLAFQIVSLRVRNQSVRIEEFHPRHRGIYPIIIMIHGSGGLLTRDGSSMPREENFGELHIACAGYTVLLVHYLDMDGILSIASKVYMEKRASAWLEVLQRSVDYAHSLYPHNPPPIAVFGESLGGYLALSLAMRDPRIKSVSEYAGGLRLEAGEDPTRLPPTLIQHGSADSIVSVQEAFHLEGVLAAKGVPHQMQIYEGLNHYPDLLYRQKMEQLTIRFFDETLKHRGGQPFSLSRPRHNDKATAH